MSEIREEIHDKVAELAAQLGRDAKGLKYDEPIPPTGLLDSAALMELIVWFETAYDLSIEQDQVTMENFGTIDAMAAFRERNGANR